MEQEELLNVLMIMAENDTNYQQALLQLKEVETEYTALLETLPQKTQEVLERYIAACEAMDDALVLLAYQFGRTIQM